MLLHMPQKKNHAYTNQNQRKQGYENSKNSWNNHEWEDNQKHHAKNNAKNNFNG